MILFNLALYGIPIVLALVTVWIGAKGLQFYWVEVVKGGDPDQDRATATGTAEDHR